MVDFFLFIFLFKRSQIDSNQIKYLVRSSLVQLCCGLHIGRNSVSQSCWSHWTELAKVWILAITAGSASVYTRRCQPMDQFQASDKLQF